MRVMMTVKKAHLGIVTTLAFSSDSRAKLLAHHINGATCFYRLLDEDPKFTSHSIVVRLSSFFYSPVTDA
ncbi:hypothetical protein V2J09_018662 [Rumex salicifolius]